MSSSLLFAIRKKLESQIFFARIDVLDMVCYWLLDGWVINPWMDKWILSFYLIQQFSWFISKIRSLVVLIEITWQVPSIMHWLELGVWCTCVLFKSHRWRAYQYFSLMIHCNISRLFSSLSCMGISTVATICRPPTQSQRCSTLLEIATVELPVLNNHCESHLSLDSKRSSSLR